MAAPQQVDLATLQAAFVEGTTKEVKVAAVPLLLKELRSL